MLTSCDTNTGQSSLPTTCPICEHSPLSAEDCTVHRSLRTTIRVFIRTEEKKRESLKVKEAEPESQPEPEPASAATEAAPETQPENSTTGVAHVNASDATPAQSQVTVPEGQEAENGAAPTEGADVPSADAGAADTAEEIKTVGLILQSHVHYTHMFSRFVD